MPDWVHVWFWLRFLRTERNLIPLPQQGINPEAMSMVEYEAFENEWVRSGAPQTTAKQVVMAMGGEVVDDEYIPF